MAAVYKVLILSIFISYSSALFVNDFRGNLIWTVNLALIPALQNSFLLVSAVPPPEEKAKLKEKIAKGQKLLEDLNEHLESIKVSLVKKKDVDKDTLDKIVMVKDDFKKLQVDPGDLPADLIERFKQKTIEAFKLIIESYGLDKLIKKQQDSKNIEEQVDNNVGKNFAKEL